MKNLGKRILSILCVIALVLPMMAVPEFGLQAEAAEGLDLAQMQIVTPASVVPVVRSAATELQTYIQKITGTKISIVTEGENSGAGIYIGKTDYAAAKGITYPTEGDEKGEVWAIQAVDGNLVLCGGSTRGVLYAVYHLLEDVLGVRWWNIWEEYVPTGSAIVPADYADSGIPAMEYREIFVGKYTLTDYRFYVRNRLNGNVYSESVPASYGGEESYGYAHVHTFGRYFTASDLASNPEWFSLVDGSRTTDQLCLTNAELKEAFASRLLAKVAEDTDAIYSVSPNDNINFCECSSCASAISTYGCSGYILNFVNEMAQAVTDAGYTDATVEMLVYWIYLDVPTGGVTPKSNVTVRFADNYTDLLHSVNHSNNAQSTEKLKGWIDICSNDVYYWQYVVNYQNNGIFPTMFHYGEDITTLQEMGVNGWFAEQEQSINTDFWDMKQWLMAKLMEEPVTGDAYTALMDEFIYGYYGEEAGKHIRDYLYYMNEKAEAVTEGKDFGDSIVGVEWLSVQDIIAGNEYFEKAFAAASSDETLLRRLRAARTGLDRAIVENYARWTSEAANAGVKLPFTQREVGERLYATLTEQVALRGAYDGGALDTRYDCYSEDQPELPGDLSIDPGHYAEFTAEDMMAAGSAFSVVEDTDSLIGTAVRGDSASDSSLVLPYQPGRIPYDYHPIGYYDAAAGKATVIYDIQAADIQSDQGYQLYAFQWTVPSTVNDGDYIYMFGSWGLQIKALSGQLRPFAGQTVTVYLNMKVTGDIDGSSSMPVYYIDRMIIVPHSQLTHSYVVGTDVYGTGCRSVCSVCGDVQVTEHSWDNGVISKKPTYEETGEKLYTCSVCGSTKTEVLPKLENNIPEHICADNREGDFCTVCGAQVYPSVHEAFDYNYTYFSSQENVVSDADAYNGYAIEYTVDLSAASIPLYRYETGNPEFQYEYLKLGAVAKADLKTDGAYHIYSFTTTLPADGMKGDGNLVYFTDSWTISNTAMAKDLYTLAGKTVTVTMSMKITGDDLSKATVCVDRMQVVDYCKDYQFGSSCSKCGAEIPVDTSAHALYTYGAANFNGTQVSDADAYNSIAGEYTGVDLSAASIPLYRYEAGNPEFQYEYMKLGTIAKTDLQTDGAYHTYSITATIPAEGMLGTGNTVYFTDAWTIQNAAMAEDLYALAGKTVTITMSMKITGDLSSATVHMDKMQIMDSCEGYASENGTYCTVCGKSLLDESLPRELQLLDTAHINRYDTSDINKKSEESFVSDSESPLGTAWTYEMNLTSGLDLRWYAAGVTDRSLLKIPYADIVQDDGYHFYKTSLTIWEDIPSTGDYTYIGWRCLNPTLCNDIGARAGQTVDIYLSMKVTDVYTRSSDSAILGDVYIDQMILVDSCINYQEGDSCSVCGADLSDYANPDAHIRYTYGAANMNGTAVTDADAYGGTAAQYTNQNLTAGNKITIYLYDSGTSHLIGKLAAGDIKVDQGYQTYSFTFTVPENISSNPPYVYFTASWGVQNSQMADDLRNLTGKTVTLEMSMKVEGELTAATVSFDKMQLIDSCVDYISEDGTYCTVCRKGLIDETLPEELQSVHIKHLVNYDASDFALDGGGEIIADADSAVGQAYYKSDVLIDGYVDLYRYAKDADADHQYLHLMGIPVDEINFDGGYAFYSNTVAIPADIADPATYVTVATNELGWYCQNYALCEDLVAYAGKTVDIYLSMKVVGTADSCQLYIDRMILVDRCENHWGEGVVTQEPTAEAEGVMTYTCAVCGKVTEEAIAKLTPATSWNLVLDGNIGMNFVLNVTAEEAASATVEVTVNGETVTKNVADLLADGQYVLNLDLAAAQMQDAVTVKLTKGGEVLTKSYSAREYADVILSGSDYTEEAKTLVKYMLSYGAASQTYFGYNTENLADDGIEVTPATVPTEGGVYQVSGSATGLKYYGASLVYRNKIAVRIYFTGDVTGKTFTVNGAEATPEAKDEMYYIEVADICPQDLDEGITVAVDGLTVSYAPMDYIIRMYAKGGNSAALVQALYGYYTAAEAYAG